MTGAVGGGPEENTGLLLCVYYEKHNLFCTQTHLKQPFRGGGESREGEMLDEEKRIRGKRELGVGRRD